MNLTPLQDLLVAVVKPLLPACQNCIGHPNAPRCTCGDTAVKIASQVLDTIAAATPAEVIEEGTYLLGASYMWADTQGTKATEHMVRRITGADAVVRGRLEKELADLRADIERYNVRMVEDDKLRSRLTGHSWSSKAVMQEVMKVMDQVE